MKKTCLIFILLAAFSMAAYCQDPVEEEKNFHFIEAGIGTGHSATSGTDATFTVAMSNGLGKYIANFLDYNLYFDKSTIRRHEISFKLGPYFQFSKYSYVALSAGASLFMNATDNNRVYRNGYSYYEDGYLLNIPVQGKFNLEISEGLCFGLKGTYNKMVDKHNLDRRSFMIYLAYGW